MSTIGIAIPCYRMHFKHIPDILKNIQNSTRLPDHVVFSCSSSHRDDEEDLTEYGFPVTILYTTKDQNAAQNRNRAASRLKTDYISFIDADDRMHPKRLEIVSKFLDARPTVDAVYHAFIASETYNYVFTEEDATSCVFNVMRNPYEWTNCLVDACMHHAHVTVRSSAFQKLKFVEDDWAFRIEDGIFARQLIEQGFNTKFIPYRLTTYIPNIK
jgi:glycosyltransferase involved in cell wall biosynthesis